MKNISPLRCTHTNPDGSKCGAPYHLRHRKYKLPLCTHHAKIAAAKLNWQPKKHTTLRHCEVCGAPIKRSTWNKRRIENKQLLCQKHLKITVHRRIKWTEEKVSLLKTLYDVAPNCELAAYFGFSVCAVQQKAQKLGLTRKHKPKEAQLCSV